MKNVGHLLDHEHRALCEALRRDMRSELEAAGSDPEWSQWHLDNARHDLDLLEVVNPKSRGLRSPTMPVAPMRPRLAPVAALDDLPALKEA